MSWEFRRVGLWEIVAAGVRSLNRKTNGFLRNESSKKHFLGEEPVLSVLTITDYFEINVNVKADCCGFIKC
jgi:hypothetical protein